MLKNRRCVSMESEPYLCLSVVGMIGWGLVVGSWCGTSLLLLWAFFYVIAPFLEEPWLEQQYGDAFLMYKSSVPRFVGWI